ncbi:MAG: fused MFS/spermidine synthase [Pirellulales bacterium]|nr:fused MFS/spermidine synthase [Pirellulales bacterium]
MFSRTLLPRGLLAGFACLALAVLALALCGSGEAEERTLFEKTSLYSRILVTENDQGLRILRFEEGGARQSVVKLGDPDHIELPYARVMPVGLALVAKPQRVLIVGLGGGTIPGFLHAHFPQMRIDVVDIDADVVEVAKTYFGFREDPTMRAYVEDGRRFIEKRRNLYDLILLDAFSSDDIPYALTTREFLRSARDALTAQGIVVGNVWGRSSNRLYDSMVRTYQDVFEQLYIVDVPGAGNKILIALPRRQRVTRDALARRAGEISKRHRFRFDMGDLVEYGFQDAGEEAPRGRVLTDKDRTRNAG